MRKNINNYLAQAQSEANQNVMSADGSRRGGRSFGADGFLDKNLYFTNDINPGEFYGADAGGAAAQAAAPLSQPYILQISNASAAAVNNFNIWGSNIYLGNTFSGGNLTINGVTISASPMNNSNITYYSMLQQAQNSPFTVGKTYLASLAGAATQVFQPISVYTQDSNGNTATKLLTSPLSPNQFQSAVYENNFPYRIDGNTLITMTILASAVFQIYFYPSYTVNLARPLGDQPVGRGYTAPQISMVQPVKQVGY